MTRQDRTEEPAVTFPVPLPPFTVRTRLRLRWARRCTRARLAGALHAIAERLDPPPAVLDRARAAAHPSVWPGVDVLHFAEQPRPAVVEDGIAQGRADLQLVHGQQDLVRTPTVRADMPCLCTRLGRPDGEPHLVGCARRPDEDLSRHGAS